ncbi:hypothetical protein DPMN_111655 [Dreissena polymorpha]|uniref:Uncharacterized protein n=1 Tax=Dreissena polymorpha TaxID=45954 RepID=A0A9D4QPZ9_DREPO|nr:hypothetical protein DPMN_111655 [Dreissena polymorpha]
MTRFVCEWLFLALLFSSAYGGHVCIGNSGLCPATDFVQQLENAQRASFAV